MTHEVLTLERMRADIAAILEEDIADIGDDDNLIDLGLDSVRVMTLAQRWREAGARLDFAELIEHVTLASWWALAERRLGADS